jgi:ketosteroid isomerase-like protein
MNAHGLLMVLIVGTLCACAGGPDERAPSVEPGAHAQAAASASIELPPELARVLRDYEAAWQAHDAAGLAALFTEDGFVLSSGRPPVRGRAAIEERYATSGGELALRALHAEVNGPLGIIVGGYGRSPGGPDLGKFTLTLRRGDDGRWLILSDMDNGNTWDG